jgi:hypothetical protein
MRAEVRAGELKVDVVSEIEIEAFWEERVASSQG